MTVFPVGKDSPDLRQLMVGGGNPSAWQACRKVERPFGVARDGGTTVKIGRPVSSQQTMIEL